MFDQVLHKERVLSNGDVYIGSYHSKRPHGNGKYLWRNGCMYDGEWLNGKQTGFGKMSWPSGATYEGQFMAGVVHGFGTYIAADGGWYQGGWCMNQREGFGIKHYVNGDVYEGSWRRGVQEGVGKYSWNDGTTYIGDWKSGTMAGSGVLIWAFGCKYSGEFLNGQMTGDGIYTLVENSKSANVTSPKAEICDYSVNIPGLCCIRGEPSSNDEEQLVNWSMSIRSLTRICPLVNRDLEQYRSLGAKLHQILQLEFASYYVSLVLSQQDLFRPVVEKPVYKSGILFDDKSEIPWRLLHKYLKRQLSRNDFWTYMLILNLQRGIRFTLEKISRLPRAAISAKDFGPKATIYKNFTEDISLISSYVRFEWKDYCPLVFRDLRELFKIDTTDYLVSICGNSGLKKLSSPGKSGSIFYVSRNGRFMIKTMRQSEAKVLLSMLPKYYQHVKKNENTLLTKFYGLHEIKLSSNQKIQFVVMGNILPTDSEIHKKFDLKGSSQGRYTGKVDADKTTTLKDLDVDFRFWLESSHREALLRQIGCDLKFLESECIMDYSLLLGVHFKDQTCSLASAEGTHVKNCRTPISVHKDDKLTPSKPIRLDVQLGTKVPARANHVPHSKLTKGYGCNIQNFGQSFEVVLYFGIIDVLQQYDIGKKLEHAYKSLLFDSSSISSVSPNIYSRRFQEFLRKIFPGS